MMGLGVTATNVKYSENVVALEKLYVKKNNCRQILL